MDRTNDIPARVRPNDAPGNTVDVGAKPVEGNGSHDIRSSTPFIRTMSEVLDPMGNNASETAGLREALAERCVPSRWSPDPTTMVPFDEQSGGTGREEFRALRARLNLVRDRQRLQKLLITSAVPAEGKTFVAANLAQAISWQQERHVLLVDADLRASHLHVSLGAPSCPGLSDYLNGSTDEYAIVKRGSQPNFFFIPGGRPVTNPTELLENGRFKVLLQRMASAFDWIIVDAPPAVPIPDAKVIGELCEGVLIVVRAGKTPFDLVQRAYSEFRGKPFLGVVLNRVDARLTYGYHYYYGKNAGASSSNRKER